MLSRTDTRTRSLANGLSTVVSGTILLKYLLTARKKILKQTYSNPPYIGASPPIEDSRC